MDKAKWGSLHLYPNLSANNVIDFASLRMANCEPAFSAIMSTILKLI
jgi:hypothetical protein